MSENKKVEAKKSPNVWVTILCIVLIIAMFFVGWFAGGKTAELEDKIVDKATGEKDEKKEEKVEKDVELTALRDDFTEKVEILEMLNVDIEETSYMNGNIYVNDISDEQISNDKKLYNILEVLYFDYRRQSPVTTNYNFGSLEIYRDSMTQLDVSEVEEKYKRLYGNKNIEHKNINGCPMFIYDSANKKYYGDSQCGGTTNAGIFTYINRMTTMGNNAYVYVSLGAWQESNVYTDFERKNLYKSNIINYNNIVNESNYQDFSQYKYTFVNEDGNYIFKSLKRVK